MIKEISNEAKFNVVKTITLINKRLEDSELDDKVLREIKKPLQDLSNYLSVATDSNQAIIFAIIFALQIKHESVDLRHIIIFLNISYIDALNFKNDIDKLLELNLIEIEKEHRNRYKKSNFSNASYIIAEDVSESIYTNQIYLQKTKEKIDIYEFVRIVSDYISQRGNDMISTFDLFHIVEELESENQQIEPILKVQSILEIDERTLLYETIHEQIVGYPCFLEKTLRDMYQNPRKRLIKTREFIDKTNKMYDLEYITLGESKFVNDFTLNLTTNAIEIFMQKDAELFKMDKKNKNILFHEDIKYKELYYEPNLEKEVNFLTESLKDNNFKKLQDRLEENNLSKGVAIIFFGSPGTGKTETVFQLAKATKREIFQVNISESKSMWFGESEKLIKEIFDSYKKICNNKKNIPILLFNEADAILSKRLENSQSNTGQTENAIQNILLEELERFEGIMVATTNLENNLDKSYERRFLFKIKFESPTNEIKSKIWKSKLSWINEDFAQKLAVNFSFSGGEIDNIVRKVTMKEVLTGNRPDSNEIYDFCKNDKRLSGKNGFKIGYL
ncbi:MAG TPA: ATP-binding protein [Paludibacter sp.]